METLLIGIGASLATEAIVWLNKKLSNTVLKGDGAVLLSAVVALGAAALKVAYTDPSLLSLSTVGAYFAQVWVLSQVFFLGFYQLLGLDVNSKLSAPTTP